MQVTEHWGFLIDDPGALGSLRSVLKQSAERLERLAEHHPDEQRSLLTLAADLRHGYQFLSLKAEPLYREVKRTKDAEVIKR